MLLLPLSIKKFDPLLLLGLGAPWGERTLEEGKKEREREKNAKE